MNHSPCLALHCWWNSLSQFLVAPSGTGRSLWSLNTTFSSPAWAAPASSACLHKLHLLLFFIFYPPAPCSARSSIITHQENSLRISQVLQVDSTHSGDCAAQSAGGAAKTGAEVPGLSQSPAMTTNLWHWVVQLVLRWRWLSAVTGQGHGLDRTGHLLSPAGGASSWVLSLIKCLVWSSLQGQAAVSQSVQCTLPRAEWVASCLISLGKFHAEGTGQPHPGPEFARKHQGLVFPPMLWMQMKTQSNPF